MRRLLLALVVGLTACDDTISITFDDCALELTVADGLTVAAGDLVTIEVSPASDVPDTRVRVAGVDAPVVDVARPDACTLCDGCLLDAGELTCGTCEDCDAICADACDQCTGETVTFTVPDVPAGAAVVVVTNRHGTSISRPTLTILGTSDSGDTGGTDTGDSGNDTDVDTGDSGNDTDVDTGDSGASADSGA